MQKQLSLSIGSGELLRILQILTSMRGFVQMNAVKDADTIADDVVLDNFMKGAMSVLEEGIGIKGINELVQNMEKEHGN